MKGNSAGKRPGRKSLVKAGLPDFSHSLPMLLLRGREAVMRYFRPSLHEHGLTEQQWRVLRALNTVREMEVLRLADVTYLLAPSMSRILKDLQRRGLVTRRSDQSDMRRSLVAISDKGVDLIKVLSPYSEKAYALIAQRFGRANYDTLGELLRKLDSELQPDSRKAHGRTPATQHKSGRNGKPASARH